MHSSDIDLNLILNFVVQYNELIVGMLVLGDRKHRARYEGFQACEELKKVEAESRAVLNENQGLKNRVSQLEKELAKSRAAESVNLKILCLGSRL